MGAERLPFNSNTPTPTTVQEHPVTYLLLLPDKWRRRRQDNTAIPARHKLTGRN